MYFDRFGDDAHIWIYGFSRTMSDPEKTFVDNELRNFIDRWHAHGKKVAGDYLILENRFAILAAPQTDFISGCSVDSSIRVFKHLKEAIDLDGLDVNLVFYRKDRAIRSASRFEFQQLIDRGELSPESMVFDTTIQTLKELRSGKFEQQLSGSWHAGYFSLSA